MPIDGDDTEKLAWAEPGRSPGVGPRPSGARIENGRQEREGRSPRWAEAACAPFARLGAVVLTTYRRDGTPVATPVNIAVAGGLAFVGAWGAPGKIKRIGATPEVEIAPSTVRGRPTGTGIRARTRILDGAESDAAGRALARKHPRGHGITVPLVHGPRGNATVHLELRPVAPGEPLAAVPTSDPRRRSQEPAVDA